MILASNQTELQQMMNRVVQHSESLGLMLNVAKTKFMVSSKQPVTSELWINGENMEQVSSFRYLGTTLYEKREIRNRIEQARNIRLRERDPERCHGKEDTVTGAIQYTYIVGCCE